MRSVLPVVFALISTAAAAAVPLRRHDGVITRSDVVSMTEFERRFADAAAESSVGPELGGALLAEFRSAHRRRVVPAAEWRLFALDFLYRRGVPYVEAVLFLDLVGLDDRTGVDVGFLDLVRHVDFAPGTVRRAGEAVSPPRPIRSPGPSAGALQGPGPDGVVAVTCVVLPDGSVANCRVARSLGRGIDEAVLLTVQNEWRFSPARCEGAAVPVEATVEVVLAGY